MKTKNLTYEEVEMFLISQNMCEYGLKAVFLNWKVVSIN